MRITAEKLEFEKLQSLRTEMENLMTKYKHLKNIDPTTIVDAPDADSIIILQPPPYFKISRLQGIERNIIIIEIHLTLFQLVFVVMAILLMSKVPDFWKQSLE